MTSHGAVNHREMKSQIDLFAFLQNWASRSAHAFLHVALSLAWTDNSVNARRGLRVISRDSLYWPSRGTRVGLKGGGRGQGEVLTVLVSTRRQHKHKTSTHAQRTTQAGFGRRRRSTDRDSRHEHEHRTPRREELPLLGADSPLPSARKRWHVEAEWRDVWVGKRSRA